MARNGLWLNPKNFSILIWICSTLAFLAFFLITSRTLSKSGDNSVSPMDPWVQMPYSKRRTELYEKMSRDLDQNGPAFLSGGVTSQALSLSELFTVQNGRVAPVLKAADPPVRACVLYLDPKFSRPISQIVKSVFLPYFDEAIWFQNESLYHFSMFHASHHREPVVATANEVDAEASAVEVVAKGLCPLRIMLERVVLTSTGVLLGCWQVLNGTDPTTIRSELSIALPHAPKKQMAINDSQDMLAFFHELVSRVNKELHGFEATVSELWFVEEFDVLALALNGRIKSRQFHFKCSAV